MDFYEVLTLASIVERETSVDSERDLVAGVYTNRLSEGGETAGLLQADPTVSYAVDTDRLAKLRRDGKFDEWQKYRFWSAVKKQASRRVSEDMVSYQTYQNPGLPDGPIDSPTLALDPGRGETRHERRLLLLPRVQGRQDPQVREDPRPAETQPRALQVRRAPVEGG